MGLDRYQKWLPQQGAEWLSGLRGQALKRALGAELDYQTGRLLQGLLARFPTKGNVDANGLYGLPPTDALDQQGLDRRLRRGPGESDADYSARLYAAWEAWQFAGSHYGVLRALANAGYAAMKIIQQNGRYAYLSGTAGDITDLAFGTLMPCANRPAFAPGATFSARTDFYSEFVVLFTTDAANLSDSSGQAILVEIVKEWKPAKAHFVAAVVLLTGSLWGWPTTRKWGDAGLKWGSGTTRIIQP
jgi:hypothetical protein